MPTNNEPKSASGTGTIPKSNLSNRSNQNLNHDSIHEQSQGPLLPGATRLSNNDENSRVISINGRQSTPLIDGNFPFNNSNVQALNNSQLSHSIIENSTHPEFDDSNTTANPVNLSGELDIEAINPLILSVSIHILLFMVFRFKPHLDISIKK